LVPFELVLAPGLRTGGSQGPIKNNFVLGVVGQSDALSGVQLSLAGNIVQDEMRGLQLSSVFNVTYGPVRGAQVGAIANVAGADIRGFQVASGANVVRGSLRGGQASIFNWVRGDSTGAQVGVANVTQGNVRGPQVGVANVANSITGAQIAVVNVGGTVRGTQIGVVNVADEVHGAQIGVVNVARRNDGVAFGLVPVIGNGYNRLTAWSADTSLSNIGAKIGTPHVYTIWGFGLTNNDNPENETEMAVHFGIGGHIVPRGSRLFIDVDAIGTSFVGTRTGWDNAVNDNENLSALRIAVGWQFARHLAVYAGPTFNVHVFERSGTTPQAPHTWDRPFGRTYGSGDTTVRLFPGLVAGVQL
jgi:hypothetical protein